MSKEVIQQEREYGTLGMKFMRAVRGHDNVIWQLAWSLQGNYLASASSDGTAKVWPLNLEEPEATVAHPGEVTCVEWSPNGEKLATGSWNGNAAVLSNLTRANADIKIIDQLSGPVQSLSWSSNGQFLAIVGMRGILLIWDARLGGAVDRHMGSWVATRWSPQASVLAASLKGGVVRLFGPRKERRGELRGHRGDVNALAWTPDGRMLATGSEDKTIRVWDLDKKTHVNLEGHTSGVTSVDFSSDGALLASVSSDGEVAIWRSETWQRLGGLTKLEGETWSPGAAFHPSTSILAVHRHREPIISLWHIDLETLLKKGLIEDAVRYTTARVALLGDSGVGKTGLGWRLAHGEFREHPSTHGQQFWVVHELGTKLRDGTECEAVLWDLAGQPDYRVVHSLFLDDVDVALLLFDPTDREDPFGTVAYWLKQLSQSKTRPEHLILVGARLDRGAPTVTEKELAQYCEATGISGGYVGTSAKEGTGLAELTAKLRSELPWERMPATITTTTFKRIKEYILAIRERRDLPGVLMREGLIERELRAAGRELSFTAAELHTAIKHLENHGYVTLIYNSDGTESILLFPDRLVNLAHSFVLEARRNPKGLGALDELELLEGAVPFREIQDLSRVEQEALLDATSVLFLSHNMCFRETVGDRTLLIFPSLINEKRPKVEDFELIEDVSYKVSGTVENVYAAMVVLLGYTNTFARTHQWRNQAQYEMDQLGTSQACGFRQVAEREGEIELILYFGTKTQEPVRTLFRGLFETFLSRREDVEVHRYPFIRCPICEERQERVVVIRQLERSRDFLFCNNCGEKLVLPTAETIVPKAQAEQERLDAQTEIARRRTAFEVALVRVKSQVREALGSGVAPTCFLSYAWGDENHERWVERLARDLRNAGLGVIFDRWDSPAGSSITKFIERIPTADYVLAIGTPRYLMKYLTETEDPVLDAELRLINTRVRKRKAERERVIPLLAEGIQSDSFPPLLEDSVFVDLRSEELYFGKVFDLVLQLYDLRSDLARSEELRRSMV